MGRFEEGKASGANLRQSRLAMLLVYKEALQALYPEPEYSSLDWSPAAKGVFALVFLILGYWLGRII